MTTSRIRHLSPTADFPGPWSGYPPGERRPLRHLEAWVQEARRRILAGGGTEQEADSAEVGGGEAMTITYTDELTALEQAQQDLADATADLLTLQREAFDENGQLRGGDAVPAEIRLLLRKIAFASYVKPRTGSDTPGTGAPAAGPATPNTNEPPPAETEAQRRARFDEALKQSGFKWPEQSIEIGNMGLQHGFTLDEVNRWTAPGA